MFDSTTLPPCSDCYEGCLQAFCTCNVAALIDCLSDYSDPDFDAAQMHLQAYEVEALATLLVQQLTRSLTGQWLAALLHVLRHADSDMSTDLPIFELKRLQPVAVLPEPVLQASPRPKFADGASVCWLTWSDVPETQTGIILGHFFTYAHHQGQWTWKYLVWLRPPLGQVVTDTAWETDLAVCSEALHHE